MLGKYKMDYQITITYKHGTSFVIDVPETYYQTKYPKKSEKKIEKIFQKEYRKFTSALNKDINAIHVGKYLKFSNATIITKNVLGVNLTPKSNVSVIDACSQDATLPSNTALKFEILKLNNLIDKLESTNIIEESATMLKKINSMMSKNNVEVTIKAGAKKKPTVATTNTTKKSKPLTTLSNESIVEEAITSEVIATTSESTNPNSTTTIDDSITIES